MRGSDGRHGGGRALKSVTFRALVGATVIGGAVLALLLSVVWDSLWELFPDRECIQRDVDDAGSLGPLAYVLLLVVQAVLAPLPAPAVARSPGVSCLVL